MHTHWRSPTRTRAHHTLCQLEDELCVGQNDKTLPQKSASIKMVFQRNLLIMDGLLTLLPSDECLKTLNLLFWRFWVGPRCIWQMLDFIFLLISPAMHKSNKIGYKCWIFFLFPMLCRNLTSWLFQWITLIRSHAEVIVDDEVVFPVFKKFCKVYNGPQSTWCFFSVGYSSC